MLLDYHSFYGDVTPTPPTPAGGGAWFPVGHKKKKRDRERERERQRDIIHATVEILLPHLQQEAEAHVTPIPPVRGDVGLTLLALEQEAVATAHVVGAVAAAVPLLAATAAAHVAVAGAVQARLHAASGAGEMRQLAAGAVDTSMPASDAAVAASVRLTGTAALDTPVLLVATQATASAIPPTPITDIDLDAQEDGWTDERLLLAAAQLLLEDEDEDG